MKNHTYKGEYRSALARAKKVLLAAGLPWSTSTGRYSPFGGTKRRTAGLTVTRIGCSETIALHSHSPNLYASDREERRALEKRGIEALRAAGLPFDDRGWLACGRDGERVHK